MRIQGYFFHWFIVGLTVICALVAISPKHVQADPEGLVALYSFDESFGVRALDSSDNGFDGNIALASRVAGKIGGGLLFGRDNARIRIDDSMQFNDGAITVEAWIKPSILEVGQVYRIIGGYNYHGLYFQIRDGRLEVLNEGQSYHYGTTQIATDAWTHIAFTSDGTKIVTYINSFEDKTTTVVLPVQSITNNHIGAHWIYTGGDPLTDYDEEFPGIIDELRIWDTARSQTEIQTNYNLQLLTPPVVPAPNGGFITKYTFNETSGSTAFDSSGNDRHGTITLASRVAGKIGNGLLFGTDDANIRIEDGLPIDNGLITIEAWIKPNTLEAGRIYRIIGGYNYHDLYFQIRDRRLEVLYEAESCHYGTTLIPDDVWTHIVFTSDGVNISTYINGVEDHTSNIVLPALSILNTHIGANWIYTGGSPMTDYIDEFPGIIDEMKICNGLCPAEPVVIPAIQLLLMSD